jgi:hypothetical protein
MGIYEIVLPETKPETEWVRGAAAAKGEPAAHALASSGRDDDAARTVGGGRPRRGRPGVALPRRAAGGSSPPLVPDVAIEILSLDDRRIDVDDKIGVYLRGGSQLVIVVDPQRRVVELHDALATALLDETRAIEHAALPGFTYAVRDLFAVLRPA